MISSYSPMDACVVAWCAKPGLKVQANEQVLILESMKMEYEVCAPKGGRIGELYFHEGEEVKTGDLLFTLDPDVSSDVLPAAETMSSPRASLDSVEVAEHRSLTASRLPLRDDLKAVLARSGRLMDSSRPEAIRKRHSLGMRSCRENVEDLCGVVA